MTCNRCEMEFTEADTAIACDSCAVAFHEKCSALCPSELRAVVIQKRLLIFFCDSCRGIIKQVPKMLKTIDDVLAVNRSLLEENKKLKDQLLEMNNSRVNMDIDQIGIIQEIEERQNRSSNIIIRNIQEFTGGNHLARAQHDTNAVREILNTLNMEVEVKKTFRLGKYFAGKNRPMKVILSGKEMVLRVLKNRDKVSVPGLIIHSDNTKMQRDYYRSVKQKFNDLLATGRSNVKIKYVRNVPTIVDGPSNVKNQ